MGQCRLLLPALHIVAEVVATTPNVATCRLEKAPVIQTSERYCTTPPPPATPPPATPPPTTPSQDGLPPGRALELPEHDLNRPGLSYALGILGPEGLLAVGECNADQELAVLMVLTAQAGLMLPKRRKRVRLCWRQELTPAQAKAIAAVRRLTGRLRRQGVGFVLVWRVNDDVGTRLDHSRNLSQDQIEQCLHDMGISALDYGHHST
jgi:hypothetical protein